MARSKEALSDEGVELEIARLLKSPHVKLAKKAERIRNRRRQYMYCLRSLENRGKTLEAQGVTMEDLDALELEELP